MNHVLLVQRGISDGTHSVSGKSGKSYGTAVQTPGFGGVVFKMLLEAYAAAADDICGNTAPMQQWVPHFVLEGIQAPGEHRTFAGEDRGVCGIPAGCRLGPGGTAADADYVWAQYKFCAGHAPTNAKKLWEGAPPIYDGSQLHATGTTDVHPNLVDRGVGPGLTEKNGQTPPEVFAAPVVGGAGENQPEALAIGGVDRPVPIPTYGGPRRAEFTDPALAQPPPPPPQPVAPAVAVPVFAPVASVQPPAQPQVPKVSAEELIKQTVTSAISGLVPQLQGFIQDAVAKAAVPAAPPAPPQKKKVVRQKAPDAPPSLFEMSRRRAAELGMNTFGQSKEKMDKFIAEHSDTSSSEAAQIFQTPKPEAATPAAAT